MSRGEAKHPEPEQLSRALDERFRRLKLDIEETAKALGVHPGSLRAWLAGRSWPHLEYGLRLCRYLEISPVALLSLAAGVDISDLSARERAVDGVPGTDRWILELAAERRLGALVDAALSTELGIESPGAKPHRPGRRATGTT